MKALVMAFLLCVSMGIAVAAQDLPNPTTQKRQSVGDRLTTIMGTVRADGEKLTFVTDQRAWNVENSEVLKGHEGHYIRVSVYAYPDQDLLYITEVKMPTASESSQNDLR